MNRFASLILIVCFAFGCNENDEQTTESENTRTEYSPQDTRAITNDETEGSVVNIPTPSGYTRVSTKANDFDAWLRNVPLKKEKQVYLYNGQLKGNQEAQFAVLNVSVGNQDLQQCADAVMRLRAEYLFENKRYDEIVFYDNDHTAYGVSAPYTREHFLSCMNKVFGMCGTASLSKQLQTLNNTNNIKGGDVLIKGGFPGHAVIVMDVAENDAGKKIYLLAQSYMPAQDIHVLKNPNNTSLSPWYEADGSNTINTPEYTFYSNQWMTW